MQFLKESWANMAEQEDDQIKFLEALEKEPSPSSFQMVTSKTRQERES
jgi:hypothetical protein